MTHSTHVGGQRPLAYRKIARRKTTHIEDMRIEEFLIWKFQHRRMMRSFRLFPDPLQGVLIGRDAVSKRE